MRRIFCLIRFVLLFQVAAAHDEGKLRTLPYFLTVAVQNRQKIIGSVAGALWHSRPRCVFTFSVREANVNI